MAVLQHLGWVPQRMDSRSKPYRRTALRLQAIFAALAEESENGRDAQAARRIINTVGSYKCLVIVGMMADLSHEHALAKAETDKDDPDVVTVGAAMHLPQHLEAA